MASSSADPPAKPKIPRRAQAKHPFKVPVVPPRNEKPPMPEETEEIKYRAPAHAIRPGPVPQQLRQAAEAAGLVYKPELPDAFRHAAGRQKKPAAEKLMRSTTQRLHAKGVTFGSGGFDPEDVEEAAKEQKPLVHRKYTDAVLRKTFTTFDINGSDSVSIDELRHVFALIGEMPSENELKAMICLCDPRGDGVVNFDDFLNVFGNPQDTLRNVDRHAIKHLLPQKRISFDIRDPMGLTLEERIQFKQLNIVVADVRKGSQAHDEQVKVGWKVRLLDGIPVASVKEFDAHIAKIEKALEEATAARAAQKKKGSQKGGGRGQEESQAQQLKYDYEITFAFEPGTEVSSSSEEESVQQDEEAEEDEEDEDDD